MCLETGGARSDSEFLLRRIEGDPLQAAIAQQKWAIKVSNQRGSIQQNSGSGVLNSSNPINSLREDEICQNLALLDCIQLLIRNHNADPVLRFLFFVRVEQGILSNA